MNVVPVTPASRVKRVKGVHPLGDQRFGYVRLAAPLLDLAELSFLGLSLVSFVSGRELAFTFAICYQPSVCRLSVTLVHPTQAVEIFGNFFHHTIAQGL